MDKYNSEGYPDPTAAEALDNVAREEKARVNQSRLLIYVCSPFAGDIEHNIRRARGYCRFVVSKGHIPLAAHLHFPQFMDDDDQEQRELGLSFALVLLSKCSGMWVFGSKITAGMSQEIKKAKKRGIPIRYFTEKCEEVQDI